MNIVTIDFDIIMHYSLSIYNNLIDEDTTIASVLLSNAEAQFIPRADLGLYEYLTTYLIKCIKKLPKDHIFFIEDHDDVIQFFDPNVNRITPDEDFNIFNIDFHHDIAYDDKDIENKITEVDCGNWVKYLFETQSNFKQYIWINTNESLAYDEPYKYDKKMIVHNINQYNLDALSKTTDYLFVCKSPEWIPINESFLYTVWEDIYEEFAK